MSGTALVAAYGALAERQNSVILAAQLPSESTDGSGLIITPRNAGAPSGTISRWQASHLSVAETGTNGRNREVSSANRATLQRPLFSKGALQPSATDLRNQPAEPKYIYSSSHRSLPHPAQTQADGLLEIPGQGQSSDAVPMTPNGPGPVPPVPNGFQTHDPTGPVFQSPSNQPPLTSGSDFSADEPIGPPVRSDVAAPQPGVQRVGPQTYVAPYASGYAPETSGFRATIESDAPPWMAPYYGRTGQMPQGQEQTPTPAPSVVLPADFVAWWDPLIRQSAGLASNTLPVEVPTLVQLALEHAPQVQVLQADPEVQYAIAHREEAAFDWRTFLNAKYDGLNDPVGNILTTGNGDNRFVDNKLFTDGGFKRRTETGGEFRIAQSVGHQYNNSRFLLPNPQATTRLELSFRQPLLSKGGTVYNQSQIVLANIEANATSDESLLELQNHLYKVAEVYWSLYRARAEFFQRQKLLSSAQQVLQTLDARNQVDTIPRQILRARAAVARAESRMQRAVTDIRNAESRLRLLVNDPSMLNSGPLEFTPSESPSAIPSPTGLKESLETALVNRPDISRAIREMRASSVQIGVSKSELLPRLDFLVTSYVAGLQDRAQIADSLANQFSVARPGYTAGIEFEVPLGNRAAKAKMEQRQWELKRAISVFRVTVETSLTEVEIANREVDTAYREMLGRYQAMIAEQNEVAYLQDRFNVLPKIEDSTMLLLEDLLNGFERLADEESAFAQSQASYALSIIQLRRSTGTLMRSRHAAPELKAEETEWMTARAEQTADDFTSRSTRAVSFRTTDPSSDLTPPPAAWSQPVGMSPATRDMPVKSASAAVEAPKVPAQPATFGGHSFGTR